MNLGKTIVWTFLRWLLDTDSDISGEPVDTWQMALHSIADYGNVSIVNERIA